MAANPNAPDVLETVLVFPGGHHHANVTDMSGSVAGVIGASRQIVGGDARAFIGWAAAETTGAATAAFRLHDGTNANTPVIARVNLAANESDRDILGTNGVKCQTGSIYLEYLSGSFEGVIYWI